jgi:Flp pilus assembly protein TadB
MFSTFLTYFIATLGVGLGIIAVFIVFILVALILSLWNKKNRWRR